MLIIVTGLYVSFHYFKSASVEVGGINSQQVEVSLRKDPNLSSKTVTTLDAGEFSSLTKPANKWNYFYSVNQRLTIQKKKFKLGYSRVFGIFVLKTKQLNVYENYIDVFAPYFIISLSVLFFLFSFFWFRKRHQKNVYNHGNTIEPLGTIDYINSQSFSDRELKHQVEVEYDEPLSYDQEQEKIQEIEEYVSREDEKKEYEKEVNDFFYCNIQREAAILTAAFQNMAEMEKTILSLKEKYKDAEKKASILGVNLNDSKIDNLVKGRLFELFSATIWSEDYRTEIDDWTPDKGFNEKIFIKSNGNPDFVVSFMGSRKVVAVECKFRSRFKDGVFVDIAKKDIINRYKKYEVEKNIIVFILLGVGGSAELPNSLYLLPLSKLDAIKHINPIYFDFSTTKTKLIPYKVNKNSLIDRLF